MNKLMFLNSKLMKLIQVSKKITLRIAQLQEEGN
jgi:hypothetical protein